MKKGLGNLGIDNFKGSAPVPAYIPMIIALISFRISFREGMVDGTILSDVCL